jgi:hypothetical protein
MIMRSIIAIVQSFRAALAAMLASTLILAGCALTDSTLLTDREKEGGCIGGAGVYYLPRSVFSIEVKLDELGQPAIDVKRFAEADRTRAYCLDFLLSASAEETIIVEKTEKGLLSKVSSRSDDKSGAIAKNLIDAVFEAAKLGSGGGARSLRPGPARHAVIPPFKAEYDPLNPGQAAMVNAELRTRGLCLVLWDAALGNANSVHEYCDNPLRNTTREKAMAGAVFHEEATPLPRQTRGLVYRPRLPYNYFLFERRGHQWALRKTVTVLIENRSPVVALGVDRAMFAKRETTIEFHDGALHEIKIDKGSELAGAVEIPLQIANGVAALPGNIVKLQIDNTNKRANLIAAQQRLLEAQRAYDADLARARGGATSALPGTLPSVAAGVPPPIPDADVRRGRAPTPGAAAEPVLTPGKSVAAPQTPLPRAAPPAGQCRASCGARANCDAYCSCYETCRASRSDAETCDASCKPILR